MNHNNEYRILWHASYTHESPIAKQLSVMDRRSRSPSVGGRRRSLTRSPLRTLSSPPLSQNEVDELTSPYLEYSTGYTYAQSGIYRDSGPDSYYIPNMVDYNPPPAYHLTSLVGETSFTRRIRSFFVYIWSFIRMCLNNAFFGDVAPSTAGFTHRMVSYILWLVFFPVRVIYWIILVFVAAVVRSVQYVTKSITRRHRRVSFTHRTPTAVAPQVAPRSRHSRRGILARTDSQDSGIQDEAFFPASTSIFDRSSFQDSSNFSDDGVTVRRSTRSSRGRRSSPSTSIASRAINRQASFSPSPARSRGGPNGISKHSLPAPPPPATSFSHIYIRPTVTSKMVLMCAWYRFSEYVSSSFKSLFDVVLQTFALIGMKITEAFYFAGRPFAAVYRFVSSSDSEPVVSADDLRRSVRVTRSVSRLREAEVARRSSVSVSPVRELSLATKSRLLISRCISTVASALGNVVYTMIGALYYLASGLTNVVCATYNKVVGVFRSEGDIASAFRKWSFWILLLLLLILLPLLFGGAAREKISDSNIYERSTHIAHNAYSGLLDRWNHVKQVALDILVPIGAPDADVDEKIPPPPDVDSMIIPTSAYTLWTGILHRLSSLATFVYATVAHSCSHVWNLASSIMWLCTRILLVALDVLINAVAWLWNVIYSSVSSLFAFLADFFVMVPASIGTWFSRVQEEVVKPISAPPQQTSTSLPVADVSSVIPKAELEKMVQIMVQSALKDQKTQLEKEVHAFAAKIATDTLKQEILAIMDLSMDKRIEALKLLFENKTAQTIHGSVTVDADYAKISKMISDALYLYNLDRTGRADYALESAGASVITTRCSETYPMASRLESIFRIPLFWSGYSPRVVIQRNSASLYAGECWSFTGPVGFLTIRLSRPIIVESISYEHIDRRITPDGVIESAPKDVTFFAYKDENDLKSRHLLGHYVYSNTGSPIQEFKVQSHPAHPVHIVEMQVDSNHGADYTCLYRLRVHGSPLKEEPETILDPEPTKEIPHSTKVDEVPAA